MTVDKKKQLILLIITCVVCMQPATLSIAFNEDDALDQKQTDYTFDTAEINKLYRCAQSFIPSVVLLSRVKLYMTIIRPENEIVVSIRKNLDESDLTSVTVQAASVQNNSMRWVEFDFPDIIVEPGEPYYIVCNYMSMYSLQWAASFNNLYLKGKAFSQEINPPENWKPWEDDMPFPYSVDFCFKTYGKYHPPNQPLEPNGPNQLPINRIGQYTTTAEDLDGDLIRYGWDWNDDDIVDEWTQYYKSGENCTVNHSFSKRGIHKIKVIAEDIDGYQSKWSFSKSLSVPLTNQFPEFVFYRLSIFSIMNNKIIKMLDVNGINPILSCLLFNIIDNS